MKNSKEKGKICSEKVINIAQEVARKSVIIVAGWSGIYLQHDCQHFNAVRAGLEGFSGEKIAYIVSGLLHQGDKAGRPLA